MILLNCTDQKVALMAPDGDTRICYPSGYTIHIETVRITHRNIPISYWGKPYNPTIAMTVKSSIPMVSENPTSIGFWRDEKVALFPEEIFAGALLIVPRETAMLAYRLPNPYDLAARMVWPAFPVYNEGTHGRLNGTVRAYRELHCLEQ